MLIEPAIYLNALLRDFFIAGGRVNVREFAEARDLMSLSEKLIFNCTYGPADAERATLPFLAANIAAVAGQEAVVLCTVEAVRLGVRGGADDVAASGLPRLCELMSDCLLLRLAQIETIKSELLLGPAKQTQTD